MSSVELNSYNQNLVEFVSLYRKYQLMDEDAETRKGISADSAINAKQIAWIPDNLFASVVNKDGYLAVGDSLYKYEAEGFRVAPISALNEISSYPFKSIEQKSYTPMLPTNYGNQNWMSMIPQSKKFDKDNNGITWPKHNGREIRGVHTKWSSWYGVYCSIGSKVKMEKKTRFWGWINWGHDYAHIIPVAAEVRVLLFTPPLLGWQMHGQVAKNNNTHNQNVCQKVLVAYVGIIPPVVGACQFKVGTFDSDIQLTYKGRTKTDNWNH